MDHEEYEYLLPDFNPAKYKVAQLRGVLVKNDIPFPSGAKKQDLIDLFNNNVKPTAAQKLAELQGVVASHDRIEIVEKKIKTKPSTRSSSRSTSGTVPAEEEVELSVQRKSPRKAKKTKEEISSKVKIDDIPDLKAPTTSKKRAAISKSPIPKRASKTTSKVQKSNSKPIRVNSQKLIEQQTKSVSVSGSDVEVSGQEKPSPFKIESKADNSFSHDNIFQHVPSSPDFKTIPRKRGADSPSKSSNKQKKSMRKTAFSSSSPLQAPVKPPPRETFEISKFENSSPIFTDKTASVLFDTSIKEEKKQIIPPAPISGDSTPKASHTQEAFITPNNGNASNISLESSPQTTPSPRTSRRSLIPDFSKFKVSAGFAKSLGFGSGEKLKPDEDTVENVAQDTGAAFDLIESDEDQNIENDAPSNALDSSLLNLQDEIESTNAAVLKETEDAIRQVNEIFSEDKHQLTDGPVQYVAEQKTIISWHVVYSSLKQISLFFLLVTVVVFSLWYREQRVLIGYCGSEIHQPMFTDMDNEFLVNFESLLDEVRPACLKCPENAICLPSMKIKCMQDYVLYEPWYKLYGLLPFSDYCIKDQEKENIIYEVVSKSLDLLRVRNAGTKCGDGEDLEVGISDDELYQFFYSAKKSSISDEEFNEIWEKVLEDLANEPEITLHPTLTDSEELSGDIISSYEDEAKTNLSQRRHKVIFRSTSTVKLSVSCKFKKEVCERFEASKYYLLLFGLLLIIYAMAYYRISQYQRRQSKVREVSDIIITRLRKQQENSVRDATGLTNRYLSAIQLRDELLSTMVTSQRFQLWDSILEQLERSSNVRSSTKEIHGEIVRVLEWTGE